MGSTFCFCDAISRIQSKAHAVWDMHFYSTDTNMGLDKSANSHGSGGCSRSYC